MPKDFTYTVDPEFDYTIDEKGNTFIALRKIDWGNKGEFKLDIRKYYASETGETMSKGLSFLTDDGPDELTKVLLETGFGNDAEIADTLLQNRKEIVAKIAKAINDPDSIYNHMNLDEIDEDDEEDYYDPEELIS